MYRFRATVNNAGAIKMSAIGRVAAISGEPGPRHREYIEHGSPRAAASRRFTRQPAAPSKRVGAEARRHLVGGRDRGRGYDAASGTEFVLHGGPAHGVGGFGKGVNATLARHRLELIGNAEHGLGTAQE